MLIYKTITTAAPTKTIFKIDFASSTNALAEKIRFAPFIGQAFQALALMDLL